ncbi:hypothetical protein AYI69_g3776 [Smittium culicis]|uniref:Uncharacterized protein n=1 Tax=Smittium culicis TaxID=133412 RepID=A0A1R1YIV2_9FUNG|nr:hypothetical protein AYI69_g3776 [Smittium culicis]
MLAVISIIIVIELILGIYTEKIKSSGQSIGGVVAFSRVVYNFRIQMLEFFEPSGYPSMWISVCKHV